MYEIWATNARRQWKAATRGKGKWLIWATAYYTSYIELIGGALLILGVFRRWVLCLLGIDLVVVAFGHGLLEPIWDLSHVMPRALLLLVLFFLPAEWDRYRVSGQSRRGF